MGNIQGNSVLEIFNQAQTITGAWTVQNTFNFQNNYKLTFGTSSVFSQYSDNTNFFITQAAQGNNIIITNVGTTFGTNILANALFGSFNILTNRYGLNFNTVANPGTITMGRINGTIGSPSDVAAADEIGYISFSGWKSGNLTTGFIIDAYVDSVSLSNIQGYIRYRAFNVGSSTFNDILKLQISQITFYAPLIPSSNNQSDFGSSTYGVRNIYTVGSIYNGTTQLLDLTSTTAVKTLVDFNINSKNIINRNMVAYTVPTSYSFSSTSAVSIGEGTSIVAGSTGKIHVKCFGQMGNQTAGDGITVYLYYNTTGITGSGVTPTGTIAYTGTTKSASASQTIFFSGEKIISGLTSGTTYYFFFAVATVTGGTGFIEGDGDYVGASGIILENV